MSNPPPSCLQASSASPSSQPREVGTLLSSSCGRGHGHSEAKGQEGAEKELTVSSRIFFSTPLLS